MVSACPQRSSTSRKRQVSSVLFPLPVRPTTPAVRARWEPGSHASAAFWSGCVSCVQRVCVKTVHAGFSLAKRPNPRPNPTITTQRGAASRGTGESGLHEGAREGGGASSSVPRERPQIAQRPHLPDTPVWSRLPSLPAPAPPPLSLPLTLLSAVAPLPPRAALCIAGPPSVPSRTFPSPRLATLRHPTHRTPSHRTPPFGGAAPQPC